MEQLELSERELRVLFGILNRVHLDSNEEQDVSDRIDAWLEAARNERSNDI